jgi:sialate O-acetylesterase
MKGIVVVKYVLAALVLCAGPCLAEVRLPKVISPNMVLQRESEVKIWGWADPGEDVRVNCDWLDTSARATADTAGNWQVRVRTGIAGGPHTMTIAGKNSISLEQILFGEVWIASGQSNMEMPLTKVSGAYTGIKGFAEEVAAANYPEIRLFQVGNFSSKEPLDDVQSGISMYGIPPAPCQWQACTPETVQKFASTAYFFGRALHTELKIPIGIIDASWGGTSAEAWTPAAGLKALGFTAELEKATTLPQREDQKIPTRLYNGMIHPLRHFTMRGVIWYQGEGNTRRADQYHKLFSTMIGQWRKAFGCEFPFYFVQISPFNYRGVNAAFLREAQLETLSVAKTGMVVTMDIGNLADIHPKNKQEVGRRLALWALAQDYGRDVVYSGPVFAESTFSDGVARLKFDHTGSGLATRDGRPPSHFEIAGADRVFHPAVSVIDGDELVVSSNKVAEPKAVRYAFASRAIPNLINKEGLPASSFRTDRW